MNIDVSGGGSWDEPVPQALGDLYLSNVTLAINMTCAIAALEQWSLSDLGCRIVDFSSIFEFFSQPIAISWPSFRLSSPLGDVEDS